MNRNHLFAIGIMLMFGVTAVAQEAATNASGPAKGGSAGSGLPSIEAQLKVLNEKLSLTQPQQDKIKPILKELHDATEKLAEDKSLSPEERLAKVRPERYKADERIRAVLTDDQKKKLDEYEHGPHPEMHGNMSGATPPPQPPKP